MLGNVKVKIADLDPKDIVWSPIEKLPLSKEAWDGLTGQERFTLGFLISDKSSVKATIRINQVDVDVYATPGTKLTINNDVQPIPLFPVPTSPSWRAGEVYEESNPAIYLVYSDVTLANVDGRNIFGWTKLTANSVRRASVILMPTAIGPETYATSPLNTIKVETINESHITDSTLLKVKNIVASDFNNVRMEGEADVYDIIADDLNISAKTITLKNAFISSCAFHGKTIDITFPQGKSVGLFDRNFFSKNAEINIKNITDIFGIDLNVCNFTFIKVDTDDIDSPDFYMATSNHDRSTKTPVVSVNGSKSLTETCRKLENFAILVRGELGEAGMDVDDDTYLDSINALVTSVIGTVESRHRFNVLVQERLKEQQSALDVAHSHTAAK